MKKIVYLLVMAVLLCAAPVFAQQGPFTDVPPDHWAYDAVRVLARDGIVLGYPDGTFGGKRAITRYEFAAAIARLLQYIPGLIPAPGQQPTGYVTQEQLNQAISELRKEIPSTANLATKADVDALRRLIDEFRDELAALGVDVDALKRDVAALDARVTALEAEVRRVKITGEANVFGITTAHRSGATAFDLDNRAIPGTNTLGRNITVVRDFDLNVIGRVSKSTTANATINYGNYLNYLTAIDDYVDGPRPVSRDDVQTVPGSAPVLTHTFTDTFFPYYLYIDAGLGMGNLTVGRLPLQFTPYTLKKIDVDAYSTILKTDSGYYPVDGVKFNGGLIGSADITLYAAKHDENDYLVNGLTGQPRTGIGVFHDLGGNALGGLPFLISQSAGARAVVGIPWSAKLGGTFYQAWSSTAFDVLAPYDQARVYGADLTIPISSFNLAGSWTKSDTLARDGSGAADIDDDNIAWDGSAGVMLGKLGISAGYKSIDPNFAAAGFWDKIGRWTNPVNVKGPYASLTYPILGNLSLDITGEYLTVKDTTANTSLTDDDRVLTAQGGLRWGFSPANSVDFGYQFATYDPDAAGLSSVMESYITVGWAHKFNPNAGMKIGYQFISYDAGGNPAGTTFVYGPDSYRGQLGVVQLGVSF
ncbi:MAG: S-layer homology domain-containing protein [Armatimonadota bacterium]|nr:S-layer homology domain-containing protein [bacterium]